MKKLVYKIVVSDKGFDDFEAKLSENQNKGWKPLGDLAFNHSYLHQPMAKADDTSTEKNPDQKASTEIKPESLTPNEAIKRLNKFKHFAF